MLQVLEGHNEAVLALAVGDTFLVSGSYGKPAAAAPTGAALRPDKCSAQCGSACTACQHTSRIGAQLQPSSPLSPPLPACANQPPSPSFGVCLPEAIAAFSA